MRLSCVLFSVSLDWNQGTGWDCNFIWCSEASSELIGVEISVHGGCRTEVHISQVLENAQSLCHSIFSTALWWHSWVVMNLALLLFWWRNFTPKLTLAAELGRGIQARTQLLHYSLVIFFCIFCFFALGSKTHTQPHWSIAINSQGCHKLFKILKVWKKHSHTQYLLEVCELWPTGVHTFVLDGADRYDVITPVSVVTVIKRTHYL